MSKYKPATFQPTVRPDWAGTLNYISDQEKINIFTAILKYPAVDCDSMFWKETIKPDLDLQYQTFVNACEIKARAVRDRWNKKGKDIYNISISDVEDMNKTSIRYGIDTEREREKKSEEEKIGGMGEKNQKPVHGAFTPPTLEEVLTYAKDMNSIAGAGGFMCSKQTATDFFNHYDRQGWILGNGNHMTKWKPALKVWASKQAQQLEQLQ